ncbi:hypothetical protein LTR59_002001 [Friedmanniomyces endolithicus]|nr:hypothetical protein LTR94_010752 [Friedmanniomyces endolithicus]KAK0810990.1 hypothetical protein LTR59_002001 [Friedmanniomyces endolithicus]
MTTLPASLSTEAYSVSITGNEWVTTTGADSSTTVVPIILPCLDCSPIIVWDAPEVPDVDFSWPDLPELPPFHFPCIGPGCDIPPVNDGPPESSQTTNKPTETATSASASGSASSTVSTSSGTSSSSSESCTQSTTCHCCERYADLLHYDLHHDCRLQLTGTTSTSVTTSSCSLALDTTYIGGSGPLGSIWTGNYAALSTSANSTTSSATSFSTSASSSSSSTSSNSTVSSPISTSSSSSSSSSVLTTTSANTTSQTSTASASASITSSTASSTTATLGSTTSASTTSAPPITSCSLSSVAAFTLSSSVFSATTVCACNDGWVAGINTISLGDGDYELKCAAGGSTDFIMSTVIPPITSCALSTAAPATLSGTTIAGGPVCSCNNGWIAGVNTVDGGSGTTLFECAVGTTTTIIVSTELPSTAASPTSTAATTTSAAALLPTARFMMHMDESDSIDTLGAPQNVDPSKDPIPYPSGTFKIAGSVSGEKNCVYTGTASGPGTFECDGLAADQTSCFADPQQGTNYTCVLVDGSEDTIYFKVQCEW